MGDWIIRIEGESLANPLDGKVMTACLVSDETEEVQGVGMIGLDGEDLAVEGLGFGQTASLVMPDCQIEGLRNRHRLNLSGSLSDG